MTTNEIKAIIAEKIAGQGNQVDIGNGLVEVLNALADAISEGGGTEIDKNLGYRITEITEEEYLSLMTQPIIKYEDRTYILTTEPYLYSAFGRLFPWSSTDKVLSVWLNCYVYGMGDSEAAGYDAIGVMNFTDGQENTIYGIARANL